MPRVPLVLRHVPLFDRAVKARRHHAAGCVVPVRSHQLPLVARHRGQEPPVAAAPHPRGAIEGRRQEGFSGGVELALGNQVAVGGEHVGASFRAQVPNPHAVVVAPGSHLEAVGRKVPAHDALHVAHEGVHLPMGANGKGARERKQEVNPLLKYPLGLTVKTKG